MRKIEENPDPTIKDEMPGLQRIISLSVESVNMESCKAALIQYPPPLVRSCTVGAPDDKIAITADRGRQQ